MQNAKGVTLVELLITLVILSIIALISVASYTQFTSNIQKDAILYETSQIKTAFNRYCLMEHCEDKTFHQTFNKHYDNYFGDYIDLTQQTQFNAMLIDVVLIYYEANTINLIYFHPTGYWYLDDLFDYKETVIDYNPFNHYSPPSIFQGQTDYYLTLQSVQD